MPTMCEINSKLDKAGLGASLPNLTTGADVHRLQNGKYYGPAGVVTGAPSSTAYYLYEVMRSSPTDAVIMATDVHDGHKYMLAQHGGTWTPAWTRMTTDLSNYYTKHASDLKDIAHVRSTAAEPTLAGSLKVRLSGSTLYITNNGHNA